MSDQEIKELLTSYVQEEMPLICEEEMAGFDHIYSNVYNKKIGRMFWSEKYFGSKLRFGYMMRRIAVVVIIIFSLFAANEVSARVFGFNPWKYVTSFLTDSKMDVKTYTEKRNSTDGTESASVKRDVPTQIPDGMSEVSFQQDDTNLYVEWSKEEECLQYSRIKLSSDMSLAMDGEYQSKEKIIINDYSGVYYVKGNEAWIAWDDACYNHMIMAFDLDDSKEILIKMAESLY